MKTIFKLILIILLSVNCAYAASVKFAQITDVHLSLDNESNSRRNLSVAQESLKKAVKQINNDKTIDFVVFTGDVINASKEKELDLFLNIVSDLKKPYYVLMGNHDVHSIGGMSKETFLEAVSSYNPNQPMEKNFTFSPKSGLVFVMLDTTATRFPSAHGYLTENTAQWLEKTLKKNKNKKVVICQHEPLIPLEDRTSHNMLEPEVYHGILSRHNNVVLILAGHYHDNHEVKDEHGILNIVGTALFETPSRYKVIEIDYKNPPFSAPEINSITNKDIFVR